MRNNRLCQVILSHILMQSGCSLFPVLLNSFHKRGRKHYIRAVKRYYENPLMLYTMVAASLVHVWDNFEQNVELLENNKWVNDSLVSSSSSLSIYPGGNCTNNKDKECPNMSHCKASSFSQEVKNCSKDRPRWFLEVLLQLSLQDVLKRWISALVCLWTIPRACSYLLVEQLLFTFSSSS